MKKTIFFINFKRLISHSNLALRLSQRPQVITLMIYRSSAKQSDLKKNGEITRDCSVILQGRKFRQSVLLMKASFTATTNAPKRNRCCAGGSDAGLELGNHAFLGLRQSARKNTEAILRGEIITKKLCG